MEAIHDFLNNRCVVGDEFGTSLMDQKQPKYLLTDDVGLKWTKFGYGAYVNV